MLWKPHTKISLKISSLILKTLTYLRNKRKVSSFWTMQLPLRLQYFCRRFFFDMTRLFFNYAFEALIKVAQKKTHNLFPPQRDKKRLCSILKDGFSPGMKRKWVSSSISLLTRSLLTMRSFPQSSAKLNPVDLNRLFPLNSKPKTRLPFQNL